MKFFGVNTPMLLMALLIAVSVSSASSWDEQYPENSASSWDEEFLMGSKCPEGFTVIDDTCVDPRCFLENGPEYPELLPDCDFM